MAIPNSIFSLDIVIFNAFMISELSIIHIHKGIKNKDNKIAIPRIKRVKVPTNGDWRNSSTCIV